MKTLKRNNNLLADSVFFDIPSFEGLYKINKNGVIISFHKTPKIMKQIKNKKGYLSVELRKNNKRYGYFVHRLVGITFIPKNEGKDFINHIDGNKENNNVRNLQWVTNLENMRHSWANGLHKPKYNEASGKCKISKENVKEIRYLRNVLKMPIKQIAEKFNIGLSSVSDITLYRRRLHA